MRYVAGALVALTLVALARAAEPPGGYHSDEAWGFKVKIPRDWRFAAARADQPWIASRHLGKRKLEHQAGTDWEIETPEMWVLAFPHDKPLNPYKSFGDFVMSHDGFLARSAGYTIEKEEQTKIGGVPVTMFLVGTDAEGVGRKVLAWVFRYDDCDFAVAFKILDGHYDNYLSSFRGCLKSFQRIERTEAVDAPSSGAIESLADLDGLPPRERRRALEDAIEKKLEAAVDRLPEGWSDKETKHYLVLSNAPSKFVREMSTHVEAVHKHLDKLFGKAKGQTVPCIVRIFATGEELDAYGEAREGLVPEVVLAAGHGYVKDNAYEALNQGLLRQWMRNRHPNLQETLPGWLKEGFDKYMKLLRSKGRRIEFSHEDWDRTEMRLQIDKGKYEPVRTVLSRGVTDAGEGNRDMSGHERDRQARSVVYWLMNEGNRGRYRNLVRDFVGHVLEAVEETRTKLEEQFLAEDPKADREALRHKVDLEVQSKRGEILQLAFEKSFGEWDDSDWEKLTRTWKSYAE